MKALDLLNMNKPPSILLYGAAGTGKTALTSQAADGYMFDFDGGMRTALTLKDKFTVLRQAVEFDIYVDEDPQKPTAYINAKNKLMDVFVTGKHSYKAVIVDSLTGLCRAAQLHVMGLSGDSMRTPQIQHYGQIITEVESVFTILRSLHILTIVTAHEMVVETDTGNLIRIMSATKPHGMNKLQWLFDEVLYTKVRQKGQGLVDYIVSGRATSSIAVRTRSSINSDIVVNDIGLSGFLKLVGFDYNPQVSITK